MTRDLDKTVGNLLDVISEAGLSSNELITVIARLLFSLGAALEKCNVATSKEILIRYANNPTFGNALMAQAMHMKEAWKVE